MAGNVAIGSGGIKKEKHKKSLSSVALDRLNLSGKWHLGLGRYVQLKKWEKRLTSADMLPHLEPAERSVLV